MKGKRKNSTKERDAKIGREVRGLVLGGKGKLRDMLSEETVAAARLRDDARIGRAIRTGSFRAPQNPERKGDPTLLDGKDRVSPSIYLLAALRPTTWLSCSVTRSRQSRSTTRLSCGNCASARRIMESGEGLEITGTQQAQQKPAAEKIN